MASLEKLRSEIDYLDQEIVKLLERRMLVVTEIMEQKKELKIPIFDPEREKEVLNKVKKYISYNLFQEEIQSIQQTIMESCKKIQSSHLFPYHIYLVGFMGSGKSSVAITLAEMLAKESVEMDQLIENRYGKSINDIFQEDGEVSFRRTEHELLDDVSAKEDKMIISTGGGVVLSDDNVNILKNTGVIVWLKASAAETYNRISQSEDRPLLKNNMSLEKITEMLEERNQYYRSAADFNVETDGKTVKEIGMEIISLLGSVDIEREN